MLQPQSLAASADAFGFVEFDLFGLAARHGAEAARATDIPQDHERGCAMRPHSLRLGPWRSRRRSPAAVFDDLTRERHLGGRQRTLPSTEAVGDGRNRTVQSQGESGRAASRAEPEPRSGCHRSRQSEVRASAQAVQKRSLSARIIDNPPSAVSNRCLGGTAGCLSAWVDQPIMASGAVFEGGKRSPISLAELRSSTRPAVTGKWSDGFDPRAGAVNLSRPSTVPAGAACDPVDPFGRWFRWT